MKLKFKEYKDAVIVTILLAISFSFSIPNADAFDTNIQPITTKLSNEQIKLNQLQEASNHQVKKVADEYTKMSDKERMNGIVYE